MRFGAHLPLMELGGDGAGLDQLLAYARTAHRVGFDALAANDHLVFGVPWLDGPTALAAVLEASADLTLATTVALPVVRHPVPLAKALAAIDRLSGGRLVVGVGPGSSARDHQLVGLDFEERWERLDESVHALRELWGADRARATVRHYPTEGVDLLPLPAQPGGPPIWIGSWGSPAGLRRVARLGDGWLASAYNTTPDAFGAALADLAELLQARGRDPATLPNALATMWFHVTDDQREADRLFQERIAPTVARDPELLRQRLPFGSAEQMVDLLGRFREAGLQQVHVWPVADECEQLARVAETVVPALRDR